MEQFLHIASCLHSFVVLLSFLGWGDEVQTNIYTLHFIPYTDFRLSIYFMLDASVLHCFLPTNTLAIAIYTGQMV